MKAICMTRQFFGEKKTIGLITVFVSVFLGCAACYLAGSYFENGTSIAAKISFCSAAFLLCTVSCFLQAIFWMSWPRIQYGKLEINVFVQLLCVDMLALLFCFAIYGPIGFNNPKSFVAISQLAPGAFIFLFLLISALVLVTIRAKAYSVNNDGGTDASASTGIHEPFLPWFLIVYFLLLIAPYSFTPVPAINSFLTGSGKIPYRLATTAFLAVYSLYLWIKYKLQPRFDLLLPIALLLGSLSLACAFAPRTFSYVSEDLNASFTFVQSGVSPRDIWMQLPMLLCDCFVFFSFVSFFPPCVSDRKQIIIPMLGIAIYVFASCVYSYGKEFSAYISYLTGADQSKGAIRSWTQSKNAFGILLVHGSFCCSFLFYYVKKWWRGFFFLGTLVFFLTSYIAQCYSAMVPILVLLLLCYVCLLVIIYKKKRIAAFILIGASALLILFAIICVSVPVIYESNAFLEKANRKIQYFMNQEILSRTKKWDLSLIVCKGPFVFIGKSGAAETELYLREQSMLDMAYPDFHSSYVAAFGTSGLIGLLMYVFSISYAMHNIWKCKMNKPLLLMAGGLMLACILFSMPETYTLFLSMSAITIPFTYLFIVFLPYLRRHP